MKKTIPAALQADIELLYAAVIAADIGARSAAFMSGMLHGVQCAVLLRHAIRVRSAWRYLRPFDNALPYARGTVAADAWFYGAETGQRFVERHAVAEVAV